MPELAQPPRPRAPAPFARPRQQEKHGPAATILLVEDSRIAAEAIRLVAQRSGLRLRRVETLAAARAHLRVYRPDAVLIDLGLPDGCGLDLISELTRAASRPPHVAAISGDPLARAAALAAGADAFVVKPFDCGTIAGNMLGLPPLAGAQAPALPADSLAFADDLHRARHLLRRVHTGFMPIAPSLSPGIRAACRFVIGVARCKGDDTLSRAAEAVIAPEAPAHPGALAHLIALIERRLCARPLI